MNNSESSGKSNLNPVLQTALGSLDLQIETELVRYRRKRTSESSPSQPNPRIQQVSYPVDLLDLKNTFNYIPISSVSPQEESFGAQNEVKTRQPKRKGSNPLDLPSFGKGVPEDQRQEIISSLVHQPQPETEEEQDQETIPQTPPEDYLESSERLLQTLAAQESITEPESDNAFKQLLTPLGIGSILLLLTTSALLGSVFVQPETLSKLNLDRFFKPQNNPTPSNPNTTPVATKPEATIPNSPNLAEQEFIPINLDTISFLETNKPASIPSPKPSPTTTPTTSASPSIPTQPKTTVLPAQAGTSSLANALLPPSLRPQSNTQSLDRVAIAPLPPVPKTTYFYVLTPYKGDAALRDVRRLIPEASAKDFPQGKLIQLGKFSTQTDAEKFAERMKKQGLSVSVYQDQNG